MLAGTPNLPISELGRTPFFRPPVALLSCCPQEMRFPRSCLHLAAILFPFCQAPKALTGPHTQAVLSRTQLIAVLLQAVVS